ncbi:Peptidyl-prolyl cis-trans isomerase FKBP15-2 [Acorus calamus]|uniref:peptidylprolyl isomerase n=1 Tax=Acorus calamus TaxID=4465 RepID=A0AAV9D1D2_ACOCL|nr:Peptidyl-prolyl cis-trans isomerase FKBP15-2 [Acorus calamus]
MAKSLNLLFLASAALIVFSFALVSAKKSGDVKELQIGVKGSLTDGTVFDSSFERADPIEFELGSGQVIKEASRELARRFHRDSN